VHKDGRSIWSKMYCNRWLFWIERFVAGSKRWLRLDSAKNRILGYFDGFETWYRCLWLFDKGGSLGSWLMQNTSCHQLSWTCWSFYNFGLPPARFKKVSFVLWDSFLDDELEGLDYKKSSRKNF
jgi:hypothetical protein